MTVPYGMTRVSAMRQISIPRRSVASLLAATALSACASLPTPTPPRVAKTPQSYATSQALAGPARDWPADAWWTAYGDAQLDGPMQEALAGAPDLAAAQARGRQAGSPTAAARPRPPPAGSAHSSVAEVEQRCN